MKKTALITAFLFAGLNIGPLPASLAGKGNVNIILTADRRAANTVNVTIQ